MTLRSCLTCGLLTDRTRCSTCSKTKERQRQRPTTSQRGYGSAWQRTSKRAIAAQPWCTDCHATTDLTTDHVIPGDVSRLDVVCRACNSKRRRRVGGGQGTRGMIIQP